jgi:hypothetical protein
MRSVADDLRRETGRAAAALTASARIELALRLGDDDVSLFAAMRHVPRAEAVADLARARAVGRRPSTANAPR